MEMERKYVSSLLSSKQYNHESTSGSESEKCELLSPSLVTYECSYQGCSQTYKRKDKFEAHMRMHTGDRPHVCHIPDCGKSYTRAQHLYRHMESAHHKKSEERLKCPFCEIDFTTHLSLKRHKRNVHDPNPKTGKRYTCPDEDCGKTFRQKHQLVVHREAEHNYQHLASAALLHKCPECEKRFKYAVVLKRHMKIHKGYKCSACEKVLETCSQLRKHKLEEHGPDLVCFTCDMKFTNKSNLTVHLKNHFKPAEENECPREGCSRTFKYKKNLNQHIRAFHQGETVFIKKEKVQIEGREKTRKKALDAEKVSRKRSSAARLAGIKDPPKSARMKPKAGAVIEDLNEQQVTTTVSANSDLQMDDDNDLSRSSPENVSLLSSKLDDTSLTTLNNEHTSLSTQNSEDTSLSKQGTAKKIPAPSL